METWDLLYIAFVDLAETAGSGSSVRPKKMLRAFEEFDLKIKVLDGWNNQRGQRRMRVREIMDWLSNNRPRLCYIEPPAGPIFNRIDLRLIERLHKEQVPIGLFYRDCYWMFPETYRDSVTIGSQTLREKCKLWLIEQMHRRDLRVFKENVDCFFLPSATMAQEMKLQENWVALPPGCDVSDNANEAGANQAARKQPEEPLRILFVGSISEDMGTGFLLDAVRQAVEKGAVIELLLVCPKAQWEKSIYKETYSAASWLHCYHVQMGTGLEEVYSRADVCVIPRKKTRYNDFAMPIKLFEYLSMEKPVLVTGCREVADFVTRFDAGWVVPFEIQAFVGQLRALAENTKLIEEKRDKVRLAARQNSWEERAKRVIEELSESTSAEGDSPIL